MEQRQLGRLGPRISAIGLGCMSLGIADIYTSSVRDDDAAVALIRRALDLGITFLDTADVYGDSELKVGKAIRGPPRRRRPCDEVRIRSGRRGKGRADRWPAGISPGGVRRSLRRSSVDVIDVITFIVSIERRSKTRSARWPSSSPRARSAISGCRKRRRHHPPRARGPSDRGAADGILAVVAGARRRAPRHDAVARHRLRGLQSARPRVPHRTVPVDGRSRAGRLAPGQSAVPGRELPEEPGSPSRASKRSPTEGLHARATGARVAPGPRTRDPPIPGTDSVERLAENAGAVRVQLTADELDEINRRSPKGAVAGEQGYHASGAALLNG